ncbi:23S rRNA (pseudouridine(1915)-N(3))-methyltransferase RlmH [Candidatus Mycoplasma mahonii]|uniref:23S rRNA (pseudouridine(1915)-N(3))-methyltransferase RlmH n=1 Tax=Candidatus Mycoplasma mahonii TaxID=3004105 RepID=UPI0026F149B9|nr:23S rRNA (pseudouridine(1915)-N(3))-methyltransferase RlmH [Candidatus Mycoplasma mahonii]WKX02643.1 23S rRNA (pseudouridine(1915)-N(3))-methyltransferase RlmH [Candidatus Mycoplasma mahonii]
MKINIIAVGKLQNNLKVQFNDYMKKINFYANLNVIELKEINHKNTAVQICKETNEIIDHIPKASKVFLCSLAGPQYTSKEFSEFLNEDNMTFIIGGSYGVDENQFKTKIAFSKMTLPHQMFRVMLVEQIFRGLSIKNGSKYHK